MRSSPPFLDFLSLRPPIKILFLPHPHSDCIAMRFESFNIGDLHHGLPDLVQSFLRIEEEAGLLHETVRGQGREKTRRTARRKHMVRTCDIVSHGLWREMTKEYRAC